MSIFNFRCMTSQEKLLVKVVFGFLDDERGLLR